MGNVHAVLHYTERAAVSDAVSIEVPEQHQDAVHLHGELPNSEESATSLATSPAASHSDDGIEKSIRNDQMQYNSDTSASERSQDHSNHDQHTCGRSQDDCNLSNHVSNNCDQD